MFIKRLIVKNYKSIKDETFEFNKGINILVGKNSAGKSNIVSALEEVLGEKNYNSSYEDKTFFIDKENNNSDFFSVNVELSEVGKNLDTSFIDNIKKSTARIDITDYFDEANFNSEWVINDDDYLKEIYPEKFDYKGVNLSKYINNEELKSLLNNAQKVWIYKYINRMTDSKIYSMILKEVYEDCNGEEVVKYYRLPYVNGNIKSTLITSLMIPSFRSPDSILKINKWSWYGKLLQYKWNESCDKINEKEINDSVKNLKKSIEKVYKELKEDLNVNIQKALKLMNIRIDINMVEGKKEDYYKTIKLAINDGVSTPLENKGTGLQSLVIIELFKFYCKIFNQSSLIILEEPELFLHPHAKRMLLDILKDFVYHDNEYTGNQIILTTHSEEFVIDIDIENISVIKKEDGMTKKYCINKSDYNDKELQKIKIELQYKNSEIFFAEKVILVEGEEVVLLPKIIKHLYQKDILNGNDISIIKVGGKSYFKIYRQILNDLNIDNYIIADYDIIDVGINDLLNDQDKNVINGIKQKMTVELKSAKDCNKQINSLYWNNLYNILNDIIDKKQYNNQLEICWEKFKDRITRKSKLNNFTKELQKKILDFINFQYSNNIFIMKNGELENYYKIENFSDELSNISGKGIVAYKIAEIISDEDYGIEDLINLEEYKTISENIFGTIPNDEKEDEKHK